MATNKVLIVTGDKYPEGDAGAIREHSFSKLFQSCGIEPIVIGMGKSTLFSESVYDGIKYYSLRYRNDMIFFRVLGRALFLHNLKKIIKKQDISEIKGIMFVSGNKGTIRFLEKLAKNNQIELYHDSVEWYSETEFKNGAKNYAYQLNNDINTRIIDEKYNVIAISTFLERHFVNCAKSVIRIPVILDIENISCEKKINPDVFNILYAGSIGGKDHISELIEAIALLSEKDQKRINFTVIGTTEEQAKAAGIINSTLNITESIHFVGRVPRSEVLKYLARADFTFLLRPENERYAKAGFPTKVVESLASGTPVMCNYSSDLGMYLSDDNSIRIEDCSRDACYKALINMLSISFERRNAMMRNARALAESHFDWRNYIKVFRCFVERSL